jgi:zinc and cadmium transporter
VVQTFFAQDGHMLLLEIWIGTLLAGVGSVWLAALLSWGALVRHTQHLLSLAAGALLATAFMHLLPEAFESQIDPHDLFLTLLLGLLFFFLLDKAELWHHGHEHHHCDTPHQHGAPHAHDAAHTHAPMHAHAHAHAPGGWAVLVGDGVHCLGDGVLIASAFMADARLGATAALAVLAHEVPHHIGDLVVLRGSSSGNRRTALLKVTLAGAVTTLGGTAGYFLLDQLHRYLPYFLTVASSSFVYVALADLIPQLQKQRSAGETVAQVLWLGTGIALVTVLATLAQHSH